MQLNVPKRSSSKDQVKSSRNPSRDSREQKEDDPQLQKKTAYMLKCILRIQSFARMIIARNVYIEMQTKKGEIHLGSIDREQTVTIQSSSIREGSNTCDDRSDIDS